MLRTSTSMSQIMGNVAQRVTDQWNNIPVEVKQAYNNSVEPLYAQHLPVEQVAQKEAELYNSFFGPYGLRKPTDN